MEKYIILDRENNKSIYLSVSTQWWEIRHSGSNACLRKNHKGSKDENYQDAIDFLLCGAEK